MTLLVQAVPPAADPFSQKVLIAAIGAVLGFVLAYVLDRLKARRDPRKQLSWDAEIRQEQTSVAKKMQDKVKVVYDGVDVINLIHTTCTVVNTGNRVVRGTDLRFAFPPGTRLLEYYLDPKPEPELGAELLSNEVVDGITQCRYRIAHLERQQAVTFNFVTAGEKLGDWRPYSFNPEGDVDFQRRDVRKAREDEESVLPLAVSAVLLFVAPLVFGALKMFFYYADFLAIVVYCALLLTVLVRLPAVVRIVTRALGRLHQVDARYDLQVYDGTVHINNVTNQR